MERCPNCRARYDRRERCRRCGMELGRLDQIERAADALVARSLQCLADGDAALAVDVLLRAKRLRQDELVVHLIALASAEALAPRIGEGDDQG